MARRIFFEPLATVSLMLLCLGLLSVAVLTQSLLAFLGSFAAGLALVRLLPDESPPPSCDLDAPPVVY